MDIFKALKKERNRNIRFYVFMAILAIAIPIVLWLTKIVDIFFIIYTVILELLILLAVIKKIDFYRLNYRVALNKLHFKSGLFSKEQLLLCDQVAIVHTVGMEEEMSIIILSSVRFRNSKLRPVVDGFLKKYPELSEEYNRLRRVNEDKTYYFQTIRKGGLEKYMLLEDIFKHCSRAIYTESCVENIKIARGQILD